MVYSHSLCPEVKAWSITSKRLKFEFVHGSRVNDIVVGRVGTPLENRLISISYNRTCRVSNLRTGEEIKLIYFDGVCVSIATDKTQSLIAVGADRNVTFIETTNYTKVKEITVEKFFVSLAFNNRNDCMLAVANDGTVHSFKF